MDIQATAASRGYVLGRSATAPGQEATGSSALGKAVSSFEETLHTGEVTAKQAMLGQADPHALVQALTQSELAVQTVVAVRDKVVEAYQEILRMPV